MSRFSNLVSNLRRNFGWFPLQSTPPHCITEVLTVPRKAVSDLDRLTAAMSSHGSQNASLSEGSPTHTHGPKTLTKDSPLAHAPNFPSKLKRNPVPWMCSP